MDRFMVYLTVYGALWWKEIEENFDFFVKEVTTKWAE